MVMTRHSTFLSLCTLGVSTFSTSHAIDVPFKFNFYALADTNNGSIDPQQVEARDEGLPFVAAPPTSSAEPMITTTEVYVQPTMVLEPESPSTVTTTVYLTITPSASTSESEAPSSSTPSPSSSWSQLAKFKGLGSFGITHFSGGGVNLKYVEGIPANASARASSPSATPSSPSPRSANQKPSNPDAYETSWDNTSTVLQIFYPAHSVNPGQKPQGGAQFYASPIDVQNRRVVTLTYSVFFPADFDFVLAGKLPGLYGGHMGCSGGDDALDCFSTRLMWREKGAGELYLYAPKDDQTDALCNDPRSECNAKYGFSIGRGSFTWKRGAWTTVSQTVGLNTPGKQDGTFVLYVDGKRKIHRTDVFYRPRPESGEKDADEKEEDAGGGGLLGSLFGHHEERQQQKLFQAQATVAHPRVRGTEENATEPIGHLGLFFSTFFGGHDKQYETPRGQYVWFGGFAMSSSE